MGMASNYKLLKSINVSHWHLIQYIWGNDGKNNEISGRCEHRMKIWSSMGKDYHAYIEWEV